MEKLLDEIVPQLRAAMAAGEAELTLGKRDALWYRMKRWNLIEKGPQDGRTPTAQEMMPMFTLGYLCQWQPGYSSTSDLILGRVNALKDFDRVLKQASERAPCESRISWVRFVRKLAERLFTRS